MTDVMPPMRSGSRGAKRSRQPGGPKGGEARSLDQQESDVEDGGEGVRLHSDRGEPKRTEGLLVIICSDRRLLFSYSLRQPILTGGDR